MATSSQVKTQLDEIAKTIAFSRSTLEKSISNAVIASADLAAIPADYADLIATIDGYAGGDAFEDLSKSEKAKLAAEFTDLKAKADAIAAIVID